MSSEVQMPRAAGEQIRGYALTLIDLRQQARAGYEPIMS